MATTPAGQVFCPRCGKLGVAGDSSTHHQIYCPQGHGLIHKSTLPEKPEAEMAAAEAAPGEARKARALN